MSTLTREAAPGPEELEALLRLLDDDTPAVRETIERRLASCGGDLSEFLASRPGALADEDIRVLSELLQEGRRRRLHEDWEVPSAGALGLREDWERFESMLRVLSDFLHDGVTCRQTLSDALDLMAEEAREQGIADADQLRIHLFRNRLLRGNHKGYDDPRNSDLAWCIIEGKSNPIGLGILFVLIARRLELVVEPVPFPYHFLCRIHENGRPMIVDCFNRGQLHPQEELLKNPDLSSAERQALKRAADPGSILVRILNNLHSALMIADREEDAELVSRLRQSLVTDED
ncbi:MAG: transglutaminase family protein [Akkermansiaceae bacterium]|nr:transglutaminase family protein [Akkermansiaceae bacterium]